MAYFNHAFSKAFLAVSEVVNGTATSALTAGQFGTVRGSDWTSLLNPTGLAAGDHLYLVQGSFNTLDTIGNNPGHGGYKESVKSKGINPRYISRLYSSSCEASSYATVAITVACDCAPCGENLFLRLDVKGSPALRFLNHNAYALGDSSGDAAANGASMPSLCCTATQTHLDPAVALAAAAQMLLADPIISPFAAEATGGGMSISKTSGGTGAGGLDAAATLGAVAVAGTGYTADDGTVAGTATNLATTGGTGSGLTIDITIVAGAITAVAINCPGSGYTAADAIIIVQAGSSGTGATTVATVADTATYTITQVINGGYTPSTDPCTDGVTATVTLKGAYVDTQFGNCSFDTRDHYNKEPVQLIASILDETGDPCNTCGTTVTTPGKMQQTSGETAIRDLLLTNAYMQSPFNQGNKDSARIQEITESNILLSGGHIDRSATYKVYYLQHSIPRFNNPTGVFDNDQYIYKIYVKCDDATTITAMNTLFTNMATVAGTWGNQIAFDQDVDNV